jgi:hypothetical protein
MFPVRNAFLPEANCCFQLKMRFCLRQNVLDSVNRPLASGFRVFTVFALNCLRLLSVEKEKRLTARGCQAFAFFEGYFPED